MPAPRSRPAAFLQAPYGRLAQVIWATVKAGRESARAGDREAAMKSAYALLQQDASDYPETLNKVILEGVDSIYALCGVKKPIKTHKGIA